MAADQMVAGKQAVRVARFGVAGLEEQLASPADGVGFVDRGGGDVNRGALNSIS